MNHKEKNVDFAKNSLTILVKIDKNICLDTKKIKQIFGEKNFNNFMKIVQYYNELFNDVLTCKIAVTIVVQQCHLKQFRFGEQLFFIVIL